MARRDLRSCDQERRSGDLLSRAKRGIGTRAASEGARGILVSKNKVSQLLTRRVACLFRKRRDYGTKPGARRPSTEGASLESGATFQKKPRADLLGISSFGLRRKSCGLAG